MTTRSVRLCLALGTLSSALIAREAQACDPPPLRANTSTAVSAPAPGTTAAHCTNDPPPVANRPAGCSASERHVGNPACWHFGGDWNVSQHARIVADVGMVLQSLAVEPLSISGTVRHDGRSLSYSLPAARTTTDRLWVPTLSVRVRGFVLPVLYAGAEFQLGSGAWLTQGALQIPDATAYLVSSYYLSGAGIVGVSGLVGPLELTGEIALGGRAVNLGFQSVLYACVDTFSVTRETFLASGRVGASLWFHPYASVGVIVGLEAASVINFSSGINLSIHARAYDGRRTPGGSELEPLTRQKLL